MYTFLKFFCVGILNTTLDFAVLNFLILIFSAGLNGGLFVFFKSISFFVAVINSYFLNKWWVFQHYGNTGVREPILFLTVSTTGFLINVSISFMVFSSSANQISNHLAANVGALAGTCAVLAWNFFGYRSIVFKKTT